MCNSNMIEWHELQDELDLVPHLKERMLIDLVNGLHVSSGMIDFKKEQGFVSRGFGFLDGSNRRREIMIQEQTQRSLEALSSWALELTEHVFTDHNAIREIAGFVERNRNDILNVAREVLCHRHILFVLEQRIESFEQKMGVCISQLNERLGMLELRRAIDDMIEGWRSDRLLKGYPAPIQAFFVMDAVLNGEAGIRISEDKKTITYLCDRVISTLKEKDHRTRKLRPLTDGWLAEIEDCSPLKNELIHYGAKPLFQAPSLHLAVSSSTADSKYDTAWIEGVQREGLMPVFFDAEIWVWELEKEARQNLLTRKEVTTDHG